MDDRAYLDGILRALGAYRGMDLDELRAETARRRRAATRLVIQATETDDAWLVGAEGHLRPFAPRGGGMMALCSLLEARGKPLPASYLDASHPDTEEGARAVCAQIRRIADELSGIASCFDNLRTRVGINRKTALIYTSRAGDPAIRVISA